MFACLCKPNSVCHAVALAEVDPPSPYQTMDGPSSPRLRRDKVVIYLGPRLLDILLGLKRLKPIRSIGIRSCTEVRILPFHPNVSIGLFPREFLFFRIGRHCSHLSRYRGRELPATLLLHPEYGTHCNLRYLCLAAKKKAAMNTIPRTRLCSDFPHRVRRNETTRNRQRNLNMKSSV